jgi:hypothetical protein
MPSIPWRQRERYNERVPASASDKPRRPDVRHRHHIYATETTGLLIIAVVLLVLILIRYWSAILQSFR